MLGPSTLLTIVTVGVSILAFSNRNLLGKFILSPYAVVHQKQWYRIITHAFIHADWMHLLFNMIALWSFGAAVQQYFSIISESPEIHFYTLYFIAIVLSSISDIIKHRNDPGYLSLGASGAVSAVIFTAIFFNPWHLIYIFFIPCPGIIFGVLFLIYSSYAGKNGRGRINHDAHFYGSVFGFLYPLLIDPHSFKYFIYQLMHPSF